MSTRGVIMWSFLPTAVGMISIVYGSLVAGLPNNRDAIFGGHGRHLRPIFANWLYQVPTLPPSPLHVSS
jgi:hypothetical protein